MMKQLKGYLATLDVLGFSEMLQRDGYSQQLKNYLTCVNDVIRPANVRAECVVFSDSIVLTSPGDDDEAFKNLIKTCSAAFRALLKNEIPVRGAIAFGRYWREAESGSVFLAGRPIVEAYRCERASDWVGILLCSSVLLQQPDIDDDGAWIYELDPKEASLTTEDLESAISDLTLRLQPATVPYLDSDTRTIGELSGYALVPLDAEDDLQTAHRSVTSAIRSLETLRLRASQPRAQAKYRASLRWLEEVHKRFLTLSRVYRQAKKAEQAES